jgi:hypothetical protein
LNLNSKPPDSIPPAVRMFATTYVAVAAVADRIRAAGAATGRGLVIVWQYLGPGIALARPLHCTRCRRTQHYATRATHALIAEGIRPRCWWCGHRMTLVDPPKPAQESAR